MDEVVTTKATTTTKPTTTAATTTASKGVCGRSLSLAMTHITSKEIEGSGNHIGGVEDGEDGIKVRIGNIIVGGRQVTELGIHPWFVGLRTIRGTNYCGGSIIGRRWVLSAAHCRFNKLNDRVVINSIHRRNGHGEILLKVDEVVNHPLSGRKNGGVWDYDFTLLRVERLAQYFDHQMVELEPVCLPQPGQRFFGQECWIAGFGRTFQNPREYSDYLQETVTVVNENCGPYRTYTFPNYVTMCVGYGGRTTGCNGDSGGPLVCQGPDDNFILAGVASWASLDCIASEPTGYASVSDVRSWIQTVTSI